MAEGVRVDVLEGRVDYGGNKILRGDTVLDSYGPEDAGSVVRILRTDDGRYAAVGGEGSSEGEVLGEYPGDQLASALLASLTDAQRQKLGIDIFNPGALRERAREVAAVHDVDTLHAWLDREKPGIRCKRAPGDPCGSSTPRLWKEAWLPPDTEIVAFRNRVHGFGDSSKELPRNMVKDFLLAMHFSDSSDSALFEQVLQTILQRGTAHRGLPDYMVRHLGALEKQNFASQIGNEPLNKALATVGYKVVRKSYKESDLRSSNKRYDEAVVGPYKAWQVDTRVWGASHEVAQMRANVPHAGPGGTWSSTPWRNMQRVKKVGVGNCAELAAAAADVISLLGYRAETWHLAEGDHVVVVVGQPPVLGVPGENDWLPAGERRGFAGDAWKALWIVDPWLGIYCPAPLYERFAINKLMSWEAKGKQILALDPADPNRMIWRKPDAGYRVAFSGPMERSVAGGLVRHARQLFHDVVAQSGVKAANPGYVSQADQAMTRQSLSNEQNADLLRAGDDDVALDDGPSAEDIDRLLGQYVNHGQSNLPVLDYMNMGLNRETGNDDVVDMDVDQDGADHRAPDWLDHWDDQQFGDRRR